MRTKPIIKYIVFSLFTIIGAITMLSHPQYDFYWWSGLINVAGFGGWMVSDLITYLND